MTIQNSYLLQHIQLKLFKGQVNMNVLQLLLNCESNTYVGAVA